jgi:ABC-type dipeptide/oligopeptide/nickel transport system ATPase component
VAERGAPAADLLAIRGLEVEFATDRGVARVLDRISLRIAPGEVVGLVGESGCGKTTLARAILGILPSGAGRVRGGEVRFKGRDLLREAARGLDEDIRGRAITVIPQDPFTSFNPLFTVGAQIMDLMKWKSPRRPPAAPGDGRPCCAGTRGDATGTTGPRCWRRCAPCTCPSPSARSAACPTSSPADSASG